MNIDELREQIPDEVSCRMFFEKSIWPDGAYVLIANVRVHTVSMG